MRLVERESVLEFWFTFSMRETEVLGNDYAGIQMIMTTTEPSQSQLRVLPVSNMDFRSILSCNEV